MYKTESGLTIQQELFAQEFVRNGNNATEAYDTVFPSEDPEKPRLRKTTTRNACKLLKNEALKKRIEKITQQHLARAEITKEWSFSRLKKIVNKCIVNKRFTTAVMAIAEINKMGGYYAPVEAVNTNNNSVSVVEIGTVDNGRANIK